jgi:hypothetical protein
MTVPKRYTGEYKLKEEDPTIAPEIKIPTITVTTQKSEVVELTQNGIKTKTHSESRERLNAVYFAAIISVRHASHWRNLRFDVSSETEDDKPLPRRFVGGVSLIQVYVDAVQYQETLTTLLAMDSNSLSFLMQASELLDERAELSILAALFALELELNHVVPQRLTLAGKISCLEFAGATPTEAITKLRCLNNLRNQLAHGKWSRDNLGKSLVKLLGRRTENWLMGDTAWIKPEAARRILDEVIKALTELHESEVKLRQAREALRESKDGGTGEVTEG